MVDSRQEATECEARLWTSNRETGRHAECAGVAGEVGAAYTEILCDQSGESLGENNRTTWTQSYVNFGGRRHLAVYQNNATYSIHVNSLGSTTAVTDYTGAPVEDRLFYPWGQDWAMAGMLYEERFGRLQHRDSETSLDPTPNRMFSSGEGRWLSPDPFFGNVSNPQSLNRYAYALNDPCTVTDPLGLDSCSFNVQFINDAGLTNAQVAAADQQINAIPGILDLHDGKGKVFRAP